MSKTDKDIIIEQQKQLRDFEDMLTVLLEKPKKICVVVAGPFVQDHTTHYTVKIGGENVVVTKPNRTLFGENVEVQEGDEVAVIEGSIVGIVPKQLKKTTEQVKVKLTTWDEIGGLKSQIENIRDLVEMPLKHAALAKEFGIEPSKGLLLYGPPGNGKTLIAKVIASMILKSASVDPRAFVYVKGAEMLSMYVGDTEQQIVRMFKSAREYMKETGNQAVIFIDEAEAILPARGSRTSSDVDKTIVPTFLSEMDGFDNENPFILLSTNIPESIDSAVLREGRIDIKVPINRPTQSDAEEIFAIHFKGVKCSTDIDVLCKSGADQLFRSNTLMERVSGAMIKTIVGLAGKNAMKRKIEFPSTKQVGIAEEDIIKSLTLIDHGANS